MSWCCNISTVVAYECQLHMELKNQWVKLLTHLIQSQLVLESAAHSHGHADAVICDPDRLTLYFINIHYIQNPVLSVTD
jgi:hypothetical protein